MIINMKDFVTLSDGKIYVVCGKTKYNELTYYYLVDKSNIQNVKFCFEDNSQGKLELVEINDNNIINNLAPLFLQSVEDNLKDILG